MVRKARHGTRSKYVQGCRCDSCARANRNYQREYIRARIAAGITDPHGKRL